MNEREVFEYCLMQLLDRFKEKAFKERAEKQLGVPIDEDWTLEDVSASDFTRAMVQLGVLKFDGEATEGSKVDE